MVLCEDRECSVCYLPYSRLDRIPRVLHCRHTFCTLCLETMSQAKNGLLTVRCPLCRRVTCIGLGLSLQEALWVNSRLWDQIPEDVEAEEEALKHQVEVEDVEPNGQLSSQAQWCSRTKLKLPAFLRKFSLTKQRQERIVPGCNVEMRSWRRLSTEDTF
ncbi:RING finger protein 223 isoform 2-T2 [Polymixia lowei]